MTLELQYEDEQQALAETVRRFCERHCTDDVVRGSDVPDDLWSGLAELGVLALGTEEGGGGALEIAAAMEALGAGACPGPLVATFLATQLLDAGARAAVTKGQSLVAVGTPPLVAWAPRADYLIEVTGDGAWAATLDGFVHGVETLGGEPWGRLRWRRGEQLGPYDRAVAIGDVAVAAYLVGAGRHLLEKSSGYAAARVQFKKAIGDFQAVAHPLADSKLRVDAATSLTRLAAYEIDTEHDGARVSAATARLSATRAGLGVAYAAHQTFGAMGFTVEGPVGHLSRRMRQVSLHPPGPDVARAVVLGALESSQDRRQEGS